jgi:signal transduction histidine kinase
LGGELDEKENILIIDDDESTCRSLTLIFNKKGYEVETAGTGRDAIDKAQGRFFNVALVDIKLPDMEGTALLPPLKEMHPEMAVIMITAYASVENAVRALTEGASAYITKPLNIDEVLAAVRGALDKQRLVEEKRRAEEALRELDRMKSEFVSNVSHELRSPLHAIRGFTKLLLEGKVPQPEIQREFLSVIDKQSQRLGVLIDGLFDLSRLESGRFQIQKQRLSIRDVIHKAVESFYSLASDKGIVISEDIPATLPEIEADGERISQVMVNLLSNAIKFSNGGRSVIVKGGAKDGELVVQVTDRGIGITKEAMPHLFERFYRTEDSMARGGTGLGLYISRQIIEAHGGRIWAESKVGKGTTVSFALPLNEVGSVSHE